MKTLHNRGIGLVEIVIGAAIITVGVLALIEGYTIYVKYALANSGNVQAAYMAEEGIEAMTYFRDKGWTTTIAPLSTSTPYYLLFNGADWTLTSAPQADGSFVRKIRLADVMRDGNGRIVQSGGTNDPHTKKVTVTIEYVQGSTQTTRSIVTYLTNINED